MARRAIGVAVVLIVAAALVMLWHSFGGNGPQATAQMPAPAVPVTAGTVTAQDVPVYLQGIGTVQAYNMVTVKTRVDGQIVRVDFKEGQEVKEGDPLFQIDPRPYQAALEQAQAAKQKDEAQLAGANLDLDRYSKFLGTGYQTRQSYDQQTALVAQLQAAIKGDQAAIDNAETKSGLCRHPVADRRPSRRAARRQGQPRPHQRQHRAGHDHRAEADLCQLYLAAGRARRDLPAAATGAARGARLQQRWQHLAVGGQVDPDRQFDRPDNRYDPFKGALRQRGRAPVARRIRQPAGDPEGSPQRRDGAGADRRGGSGRQFAYIIKPDNTVERRAVDVAAIQDGIAVITKGLSPGERVVVEGQYRLTDGALVSILPSRPTSAAS